MIFAAQQKAVAGGGVGTYQDGAAILKDFIQRGDFEVGQVWRIVVGPSFGDRLLMNVVHGAEGDGASEQIAEKLDDATIGAVADEGQGEDDLPQPGFGDGQIEEDLLV